MSCHMSEEPSFPLEKGKIFFVKEKIDQQVAGYFDEVRIKRYEFLENEN